MSRLNAPQSHGASLPRDFSRLFTHTHMMVLRDVRRHGAHGMRFRLSGYIRPVASLYDRSNGTPPPIALIDLEGWGFVEITQVGPGEVRCTLSDDGEAFVISNAGGSS